MQVALPYDPDNGDLTASDSQQRLWDALLDAVADGRDPANFLAGQHDFTAGDRTQVAYLWGGLRLSAAVAGLLRQPSPLGV
jgi:hypothetical protein